MSIIEASPQGTSYRPVVPINHDVRQEVTIYFDEELCNGAITLLTDLITTGASSPGPQNPIYAPAPFHIELASALLIHPRHTNQAPAHDRIELASQAITFLRNLLAIVGPLNANLAEAFSFSGQSNRSSRRSRNALELDDGSSSSENEDGSEKIRGVIANRGRIRNCAKDFWHMVGWAFNCSVRYPKRWKYWKVWLDFMLDVLDADWNERQSSGLDSGVQNSLLVKYLSEANGRSSAMKRVVRAAFADGSVESLREFPEVFTNETKELKIHNGQKRKRETPIERKFGGYQDEEAESELTDQTSQDEDCIPENDPWLGGPESVTLRQRVITLLSRVADAQPEHFCDCKSLYDAVFSSIKPLPLPAFSLLLSSSRSSHLVLEAYVSLTQVILLPLLPSSAPRPHEISNEDRDDLTQDVLERCYLPFPALTSYASDNAKVSILVENLMRLLFREGVLCHTPTLDAAVKAGIVARENKSKVDKRKKDNGVKGKEEQNDLLHLKASGQRLKSLLSWIEEHDST
ncbi:uncharacterized protein LY89DRAFT_754697 [Mollisia scopiformis]|uniref:Uncharacterized protein n=1 Tax=Mollisia scopiformis TaxID=149040 RepID=A0A194XTL3_MOLSC|nr:uncharacterized protein LY89DRAFT_754697 [Mollisia scopiformis]KUJ23037.1 hypothetical protein LY89DRAFT_754697 [Mollisia scopiformis]